jgi:serine/threonine-protein kinase
VAYRATPLGDADGQDVCIKITADQASWHRECYFGEMLVDFTRAIQVLDSFPLVRGRRVDYVLALELAEHGSLASYLGSHPEPWDESRVRREVAGLLAPLEALHFGAGMHRDITPFNIFVSARETLKLGDFGIAKHSPDRRGLPAVTMNWAFAPGSAHRDDAVWRPQDDVWQVGQLLATLVRGYVDFPIGTRDVKQLPCSPELKAIIRRAIGSKTHRFWDALELYQSLVPEQTAKPTRKSRLRNLEGKTVVFTGRLWMRRADAARLVERLGGTVSKDVTSLTDVIVQGAIAPSYIADTKGVKLIKAEALRKRGKRIAIIDEAQFRRLVGAP